MDKFKIKEIIESSLKGSIANVDGSEGKYTAKIIYDGFDNLSTVGRHKIVYKTLDEYIKFYFTCIHYLLTYPSISSILYIYKLLRIYIPK